MKYNVLFLSVALLSASCAPDVVLPDEPVDEEVKDTLEVKDTMPEDVPVPPDDQMPEISWEDALTAVRNMKVGWNLGNTLDSKGPKENGADATRWETYWGQPVTRPELMHMLKAAGFDAVRVPVTWGIHMDDNGKVYPEWMARVHEIIDYVINAGMYCIINVHHDTGAGDDVWLRADPAVYEKERELFEGLWRQIAEEFKEYGEKLLFESFNEMLDAHSSWCFASFAVGYDEAVAKGAYESINNYNQSFVDVVRSTGGNNSVRNLVVNTYGACSGSGSWNQHLKDPLIYMELPEDYVDDHVIFEVHSYLSVKDISNVKYEIEDMFNGLHTHLASKGAPVIIGEWGTFPSDGEDDYQVRRENVLEFADYFVRRAKEMDFGTFFWMGLSDGLDRTIPVFSQPDLAQTIVQAYHGISFQGEYPQWSDYVCKYVVTYNCQWAEMNMIRSALDLDTYSSVRVKLSKVPEAGELHVKMYGVTDSDGKTPEQFHKISQSEFTVVPDKTVLGDRCTRMTLQLESRDVPYTVTVEEITLVRKDGTEETGRASTFHNCSVELVAEKL